MPNTATDQQTDETVEQSDEDQAGDEGTGVEEQDGDEPAGDSNESGEGDEESSIELIGQEQFDKLKDDPAALRTELNKAATKKFQQLSAARKELEPYRAFIKALDDKPVEAITAVAKQFGLKVEGHTTTEKETSRVVESLADKITAAVKKSLGPDYDDLSDKLGAAMHDALQLAVPEITKASTQKLDQVINDTAAREAKTALDQFAAKYPDWKKHEAAMTELGAKMPPGEGISEVEYLENLYRLVTMEAKTGDGIKKVVQKMVKNAKAGGNGKDTTVDDKNVSKTPPKRPTFQEAAAAARRGERWE